MAKRLSTQTFIEKAIAVHAERYDYSSVEYINCNTVLAIGCRQHGVFHQTAVNHLQGHGCQRCKAEGASRRRRKYDAQWFLKEARQIHGERYDYTATTFVSAKQAVMVTCGKHGPYRITVASHLAGRGCQSCGREARGPLSSERVRPQRLTGKALWLALLDERFVRAHDAGLIADAFDAENRIAYKFGDEPATPPDGWDLCMVRLHEWIGYERYLRSELLYEKAR